MPQSQTLIFYGLNATRLLSIVALLLVFSSSILVMVTNIKAVNRFQAVRITNSTDLMLDCDYIEGSTVPNQPAGVFWAVVASLLVIFQAIILLLSEIGWPAVFFDRFFPVLGANFGLGALGIFQCLIGSQILSHHVGEFTLVSAFFVFSVGCLNCLLGLIFSESAKTKRALRGEPAASKVVISPFVNASPQVNAPRFAFTGDADAVSYASWKASDMTRAAYGFGRQAEKAAGLRDVAVAHPERTSRATPHPPRARAASTANTPSPRRTRTRTTSPNASPNGTPHRCSRIVHRPRVSVSPARPLPARTVPGGPPLPPRVPPPRPAAHRPTRAARPRLAPAPRLQMRLPRPRATDATTGRSRLD
ncbi:hypothetical protein B0H12DRAFT_1057264 [Mycena haematopus]|nr:hypothetical protein B0H12DRAFT_1057264 [Mycena haematopus]